MNFSVVISRFSNLLFFALKINQDRLVNFNLQKYLTDENLNLSFYGRSESKIWKQIEKSIGKQDTKQIKKYIAPLKLLFALQWRKTLKHLLLWKWYFYNNQPLFQEIILEIKKTKRNKTFRDFPNSDLSYFRSCE